MTPSVLKARRRLYTSFIPLWFTCTSSTQLPCESYKKLVCRVVVPLSSVINQYNKKGQIIKREETFPLPKDPLPTQVSKQMDVYEYDTYGYLTKITFEKTLVNSDKTSGSLIFLYDEFGNQIDSNAYYEYDSTGRWIQKTDRGDAKNTEKIQIIYQQ